MRLPSRRFVMSTEVETSLKEPHAARPHLQEIPPLRFAPVGMTEGAFAPAVLSVRPAVLQEGSR